MQQNIDMATLNPTETSDATCMGLNVPSSRLKDIRANDKKSVVPKMMWPTATPEAATYLSAFSI